jgi:hypothetical protein
METRREAGFFMPRHWLDDFTMSVYGDYDSGSGMTYADELDIDDEPVDEKCDGLERDFMEIMTGRAR